MTASNLHSGPDTHADAGAVPATPRRWPLLAAGVVGVLLMLSSLVLPLWQANLDAPQYPGGLDLVAYGDRVEGDVNEINSLNHYVGMRVFDPEDVPEMALWPLVVAVGVAAAVVGVAFRRRWAGRLALLYLWLLPLGVLADIQWRLHEFGHDLDPSAALRIEEFTPWVIGPTQVWNFTTWSLPGTGLLALVAAAAVVTFAPPLLGHVADRRGRRGSAGATGLVLVLAFTALGPVPAAFGADHDQHAQHEEHGGGHAGREGREDDPAVRAQRDPPEGGHGEPQRGPADDELALRLARASAGDAVVLPPGTYQGPFVIDVPVRLDGRGHAVLDGGGTGTVLTVRAAGTVISGVRLQGSGPGPEGGPAGLRIEADDVHVEDVTVEDTYIGIAVNGAARTRLIANTIRGRGYADPGDEGHALGEDEPEQIHRGGDEPRRGDGVSLWDAESVLVRGNLIEDARDGIYVSFGSQALIDTNHVHGSRYAVHSMYARDLVLVENHFVGNLSGAVLMYGGPALLLRNTLEDSRSPSTGFGILLKDVEQAEAVENIVAGNRVGLHLDGPAGAAEPTRIRANTFTGNHVGAALYPSAQARFSANSFAANTLQVLPQGGAITDTSEWTERGFGNFWTTYRGYDRDGRGFGALPHVEGGHVEHLLVRAPVLTALASSPALLLLRAMEDRLSTRAPVLIDDLPLTSPQSPPLPVGRSDPVAGALLGAVAGVLVIGAATALLLLRRGRITMEGSS